MRPAQNSRMAEGIGEASKRAAAQAGNAAWPVVSDPALAFVTPQLTAALSVWREKRGARAMPARRDMTIQDLRFVLANLAFVAIVREGGRERYKVRLMGSDMDARVAPMTGRFIDEAVPAHFAEKWCALWRPAIETRAPIRSLGRVEFRDRRHTIAEALYAPLADDGENPDTIMIAMFHHMSEEGAECKGVMAALARELDRA